MMKPQTILLICLLFGIAASETDVDELQVVESFDKVIIENPDSHFVAFEKEVIIPENGAKVNKPIRYTMGNRIPNDKVLTVGQNSYYYPTPQDVNLNLKYPEHGAGGMVTFVEIIVEQTSTVGHAQVTRGGIGQREIEINVQGKQTSFFNYKAVFYGYD